MNFKKRSLTLVLIDFLTAALVWYLFYIYRITTIEHTDIVFKKGFFLGIFTLPFFWIFIYALQGTYHNVLRHYRLKTIKQTLFGTIVGVIIVFFSIILDDFGHLLLYQQYYKLFIVLFLLHFFITLIPRFIITSIHVKKIHKGKIGFNTIMIGGSVRAVELYDELKQLKPASGHHFIGFVNINGNDFDLEKSLPLLGHIEDIDKILKSTSVAEVIIAIESSDHERLKKIITKLSGYNIRINLIPDAYDILSGQVSMSSIFGALLLTTNNNNMPDWQVATKRILDIIISGFALILLIPVYIILAIAVKFSSKGPIFFLQERIGKDRKPFNIIKYRTMFVNAEKDGPKLSSTHDNRITNVGKFLRKTRLDEFPQFWNVLIGEMSLVGPRPERQYFIDKISNHDPQYLYLHKVRPGITSWGQVKFGYAENVEQMLQRMKYDLLYIRNMSIALDIKIMFYTVAIIFKGKGK
ncbi:sugar transferase [Crocinitomix algicola]|uniref:sugar transferase n=1 Tax=Crocinitomix algicola TaxID=1740263 RepID=UPI0008326965|nr:sugar transferase [Crocinitomix algicola]